jgi:hypothetical protein
MEHHADFAVPVTQQLWLRTSVPRAVGAGTIAGWAIALGWWVEPNLTPQGTPGEAAGTLYLIVDAAQPGPPVWVRQAHITQSQVVGMGMPPTEPA